MTIGEYVLANPDKVERATNGTVLDQGQMKGGVGIEYDKKGNVTNGEAILAEYDRLGGLILKDGKYKVKTGSFYDFQEKKPFEDPEPVLLFSVNGEIVEVSADEPLPIEVRAALSAGEKKAAKKKKSVAKKGKGKKEEVEEESDDEESEDTLDDDLA